MKALAIISVFLVLVFGFLWYSQRSDIEETRADAAKAREAQAAAEAETQQRVEELVAVSNAVGFTETRGTLALTSPKQIEPHITANPAGFHANLQKAARVRLPKEFWKAGAGEAPPSVAFDLSKAHPELLGKVRSLHEKRPTEVPVAPDDDASDAEKAEFAAKKAQYDRQFAEYQAELDRVLAQDPAFAAVVREIGPAAMFAIDEGAAVDTVDFYSTLPLLPTKLDAYIVGQHSADKALEKMRAAFEASIASNAAVIKSLREELAQKERAITNPDEAALGLREMLQREQAAHTADVARLQAEIAELTARAEGFRVEASNAANELARARESAATEKRRLDFEISALRDYQRLQKEGADLAIRRNDEDGRILDASTTLGTAYIDLGSVDRVYAGLKFEVYGVGRGGIRELKGTVLVQKVLDEHYSQVTILSNVADSRPIVRGDTIHNPFYDATKVVHVYLAGDLRKYPKAIAASRLQRANVVIDEVLGTETDWVVVPDSMTAPVEAAPAEDGAEPAAGPAATATAYDRLRERARTFGATLVTERQLEAFLDY
jgi:hypothetical protein